MTQPLNGIAEGPPPEAEKIYSGDAYVVGDWWANQVYGMVGGATVNDASENFTQDDLEWILNYLATRLIPQSYTDQLYGTEEIITITEAYQAETSNLIINGRSWYLRCSETESPDIWEYEESNPENGQFTLRYAYGNSMRPAPLQFIYAKANVNLNYFQQLTTAGMNSYPADNGDVICNITDYTIRLYSESWYKILLGTIAEIPLIINSLSPSLGAYYWSSTYNRLYIFINGSWKTPVLGNNAEQFNSISNPYDGQIEYSSTTGSLHIYDSTIWKIIVKGL